MTAAEIVCMTRNVWGVISAKMFNFFREGESAFFYLLWAIISNHHRIRLESGESLLVLRLTLRLDSTLQNL